MTDQQVLEVIEHIVADDFCEDLAMRDMEPNSDLNTAKEKLLAVYRIAHSFVQSHTCSPVHKDWRQEAAELRRGAE